MNNDWEGQIEAIAKTFIYPRTPDVVTAVRPQHASKKSPSRLQVAGMAVLLVIGLLLMGLAVPQVRAAVLRIFRIGAITILETVERPSQTAPKSTPAQEMLFKLAGETTLAAVPSQAGFPLLIPAGWPPPDRVYYQENDWPSVVIFVWLEPDSPNNEVRLSLYQINAENFIYKGAGHVEITDIKGRQAFWIEGEHWLQLQDGSVQPWHFVEGSVLIWWSDVGTTLRLESGLTLKEAKALAESFVLLPQEE